MFVFFQLVDSPASEFYVPTLRNTLFHLHGWCKHHTTTPPIEMELTECYISSAHKIQKTGNRPKERIQHFENLLLDIYLNMCFSRWFISPYIITFKNYLCTEGQNDFVSLCCYELGQQTCTSKCLCWCAAQHYAGTSSLICVKGNCIVLDK